MPARRNHGRRKAALASGLVLVVAVALASGAGASSPPPALVHLYDYEAKAVLDVRRVSAHTSGAAVVRDLNFRAPRGDRVPAFLVEPTGRGPFPAVVIQPGAGQGRRFGLGLALVLARHGIASLLSEPPLARAGGSTAVTFHAADDRALWIETVIEARRNIDLLAARPEIDARRLGYVGFSMGALTGGILAGVDPRIGSYVLQAGGASLKAVIDHGAAGTPPRGPRLAAYLRAAVIPFEPSRYVGSAAPASLFFQDGKADDVFGRASLAALYDAASRPKRIAWYAAAHADLPGNRRVVADAVTWLSRRLRVAR